MVQGWKSESNRHSLASRGITQQKSFALTTPDKHQLKIARNTLKMSDMGANVMGGPNKQEAREIIYKLTGKFPIKDLPTGWKKDTEYGSGGRGSKVNSYVKTFPSGKKRIIQVIKVSDKYTTKPHYYVGGMDTNKSGMVMRSYIVMPKETEKYDAKKMLELGEMAFSFDDVNGARQLAFREMSKKDTNL